MTYDVTVCHAAGEGVWSGLTGTMTGTGDNSIPSHLNYLDALVQLPIAPPSAMRSQGADL